MSEVLVIKLGGTTIAEQSQVLADELTAAGATIALTREITRAKPDDPRPCRPFPMAVDHLVCEFPEVGRGWQPLIARFIMS